MDCIIIAGGQGTRLRPLTSTRPKSLVPLLNEPLIHHVLRRLPEGSRVFLPVNYMVEKVRQHVDALEAVSHPLCRSYRIHVVHEPEPLGTGGAIKNLEAQLEFPVLVINGDVVTSFAFGDLIPFHERTGGAGVLLGWSVEDSSPYGVLKLEEDRIVGFEEKPQASPGPGIINAGAYVLGPEVFKEIPAGRPCSLEREVFPKLSGKLFCFRTEGYWFDAGTPRNLLNASARLLREQGIHGFIGNDVTLEGQVGPNTVMGDRVVYRGGGVVDSILLPEVTVERGALISGSLVGEGAAIGKASSVKDCVIADGARIEAGRVCTGERIER